MTATISLFESHKDVHPKPVTVDLLKMLVDDGFEEREDKFRNAYAPASFVPGTTRLGVNVEAVSLLAFDVDENGPIDRDAIVKDLLDLGVRFLMHTTHSHGWKIDEKTGKPKEAYRLLIDCSQPIPVHLWPAVRAEAVKVFGNKHVSNISSDPARLFFAPAHPPGMAHHAWMAHNLDGEVLDPLELLTPEQRNRPAPVRKETPRSTEDVEWVLDEPIEMNAARILTETRDAAHAKFIVAIAECDLAVFPDGARRENLRLAVNDMVWKTQGDVSEQSVLKFCTPFIMALRAAAPTTKLDIPLVSSFYRDSRADLNRAKFVEEEERKRSRLLSSAIFMRKTDEERLWAAAVERVAVPTDVEEPPAPDDAEGSTVFTEEELYAMARNSDVLGISPDLAMREVFLRRLILAKGPSYWINTPNGYVGPVPASGLVARARDLLGKLDSETFRFSLEHTTKKGMVPKSVAEIMLAYGTEIPKVISSLAAQRSTYDAYNNVLVEALYPMRSLHPVYNAQVEKWLNLLGGAKRDKLLDWLATADQIDTPTGALYLVGSAGCGKSMLSQGLARLWSRDGAASAENILGKQFNGSMAPLIVADEGLHKPKQGEGYSGMLRSLIGNSNHSYNRKFQTETTMVGCPRLIIASNNNRSLADAMHREERSGQDIEAIAIRIVLIECDNAAAAFLREIGGRTGTKDWVDGDVIARHLRWLQTTRGPRVVRGDRFLVGGEMNDMVNLLTVNGAAESMLLEWLTGAVMAPAPIKSELTGKTPPVVIGNGRILVQSAFLSKRLTAFVADGRMSTYVVGRALSNLSVHKAAANGETRVYYRRVRYHDVDVAAVRTWAVDNAGATVEAFDAIVNKPLAGGEE